MIDNQEQKRIKRFPFGVGCLHFGIKYTKPRKFKAESYVEDLRKTLNAIDAVSDVNINYEPIHKIQNEEFELSEKPPKMDDGSVFPLLSIIDFNFKVFVPSRIQADIMGEDESTFETESEHFMVTNMYPYHGPVTFVEPIDSTEATSPSNSVVVIREYLERQINEKDLPLFLDFTGPSPFHADFFVEEGKSKDEKKGDFHSIITEQIGYDHVALNIPKCKNQSEWESSKSYLYYLLSNELGLYYQIRREQIAQSNQWENIETAINQIVRPSTVKNFVYRFFIKIRKRSRIRKLFHEIALFRSKLLSFDYWLESSYRNIYKSGSEEVFLKILLDSEKADLYKFPTSDALDIVNFEEERATKTFEFKGWLIAAAFGSLITWIAQFLVCSTPSSSVF